MYPIAPKAASEETKEQEEEAEEAIQAPVKSVDSALDEELRELQAEARRERNQGSAVVHKEKKADEITRFQAMQLDKQLSGLVMFNICDEAIDPVALVHAMLQSVLVSKEVHTRYSIRMLPFQSTCFSNPELIEELAEKVISEGFAKLPPGTTYSVDFNRRGINDKINRDELVRNIAHMVPRERGFCVDLKKPDILVSVECLMRFTGISLLPQYHELKKYNIRALTDLGIERRAMAEKEAEEASKSESESKSGSEAKGETEKPESKPVNDSAKEVESATKESEAAAETTAERETESSTESSESSKAPEPSS